MSADDNSALSGRERDILTLTMAGLVDKEIAANLGISIHTVRTYWNRIREKIGKSTRAEVISEVARQVSTGSNVCDLEARFTEADDKRYQLELLLGRIPILVWSCDTSGHVIYVNEQFQTYAGQIRGRSISELFSSLTPPELFIPLHEKAVAARQKQGILEAEAPLRRVDGEMRWHLIRETPLSTPIDASFLRVGTATDIQVLLTREMTADGREARASLAADLSAIGIAYYDSAAGKIYSNPAYNEMTGSAAVSQDWTDAVHSADLETTRARWRQASRKGVPFQSEHRYVGADGQTVNAVAQVTSLPGNGWLFLGKRKDRPDWSILDPEKLKQAVVLLRDMLGFSKPAVPATPSAKASEPHHQS